MIRVVIAEDHNLVREGIRKLLEDQQDIMVTGEADNGLKAIEEVKSKQPDVIVLDLKMPKLNGLEVASEIKHLGLQVKIVILSMYADESIIKEALRNGVIGYVLKQSVSGDLLSAIRAAVAGNIFISSGVAELVISSVTTNEVKNPLLKLSPREREVVEMIVKGCTSRQISEHFTTSVKTVERQRRSAMQKLNVNDVATLVRVCINLGMVVNDQPKSLNHESWM
jgi:DNA-binding NarL/FixJ family response regulator